MHLTPMCKLKKVLRAAAGVSNYGTQRPPGGVVRISGPPWKTCKRLFLFYPIVQILPKDLPAAASEGEDGGVC